MIVEKDNKFEIKQQKNNKKQSIISSTYDVVISLTTYKERILTNSIQYVINSIIYQNIKEKIHFVINVTKEDYHYFSNEQLLFFKKHNIEVFICELDLKSHLKYFYTMQRFRNYPIITIDDDCLYDSNLLFDLFSSYKKYPKNISARRCHLMLSDDDNINFLSYNNWIKKITNIKLPTHELFATGVGGVLYPPNILNINKNCIDEIYNSITADDIFLKKRAQDLNIKIVYCGNNPDSYKNLQCWKNEKALQNINITHNNNDITIKKLNFKPYINLIKNRKINIFIRLCDSVDCVNNNLCKNKKREFGNNKKDIINICLNTVYKSICKSLMRGYYVNLYFINDNLSSDTIANINLIFKNIKYTWILSNGLGNINSFKTCFDNALTLDNKEIILFLEDDYICDENSISEIILFYNMFKEDIWINPTTDIGDNKIVTICDNKTYQNTKVFPSSKDGIGIWWKQTYHSTSTFCTTVRQLKKYKNIFNYIFNGEKLDQYKRNKIYEIEKCFTPIYSLMQHYQKSKTMYWFDYRNIESERMYTINNFQNDINKICISYSIYQVGDLCKAIKYMLSLAYTIKIYNINDLYNKFDIIIHTDIRTLENFKKILNREKISDIHIYYKIHNITNGSSGVLWRLIELFNTQYDISIVGDTDYPLTYYLDNYINKQFYNTEIITAVQLNNNISNIKYRCGDLVFYPKKINSQKKLICLKLINLILADNINCCYGFDELFIKKIIETFFIDSIISFYIINRNCELNNNSIKTIDGTKLALKNVFKKYIFLNDYKYVSKNNIIHDNVKYPEKLKYLNINNDQFNYFYFGNVYYDNIKYELDDNNFITVEKNFRNSSKINSFETIEKYFKKYGK